MNVLPATALSEPKLAGYLESWGWPDDTTVLDVDVECGGTWNAAWHRLMTSEEPGYGFVDDYTCGLHAPSCRTIPAAT